jgi:hypothetical protein
MRKSTLCFVILFCGKGGSSDEFSITAVGYQYYGRLLLEIDLKRWSWRSSGGGGCSGGGGSSGLTFIQ